MGRLQFFVNSVLYNITGVLLSALGYGMISGGYMAAGLILAACAVGLIIWCGVVLTIKRLHDMDLDGTHVIWITLLGVAAGGMESLSQAAAYVLTLVAFGVGCWLLFKRGTAGPNQYGSGPDTLLTETPATV